MLTELCKVLLATHAELQSLQLSDTVMSMSCSRYQNHNTPRTGTFYHMPDCLAVNSVNDNNNNSSRVDTIIYSNNLLSCFETNYCLIFLTVLFISILYRYIQYNIYNIIHNDNNFLSYNPYLQGHYVQLLYSVYILYYIYTRTLCTIIIIYLQGQYDKGSFIVHDHLL